VDHPRRLAALLELTCSDDPGEALHAIQQLRRELDGLETEIAATALGGGLSWSQIGAALGITKQAAHRRHSRTVRALDKAAETDHRGRHVIVTPEVRAAVRFAREEAQRAAVQSVGTEHLLLGVLRAADPPLLGALRRRGITAARARSVLEATTETPLGVTRLAARRAGDVGERSHEVALPLSRLAQGVLSEALRDRAERGSGRLSARDLLHAVVRDGSGGARRTLDRMGVSREQLQAGLAEASAA
jgi:ATP-dependent Clp protease ATP-binding subunit ClpA